MSVLGTVAVHGHDGRSVDLRSRRQRQLLALLVAHAGHAISADAVADALWSQGTVGDGRAVVQNVVSQLRRVVAPVAAGTPVVETVGAGYRLGPSVMTDVDRFTSLLVDGRDAAERGDWQAATRLLTDATSCWRGAAYEGFTDLEVLAAEAARLDELRLAATEERAEAELRLGRHHLVVGELEVLVSRHPLRERLWAQYMRALYAAGRQAEALRAYRQLRGRLVDELGIEPSPELRTLEAEILTQSLTPVPTEAARARRWVEPLTAMIGRDDDRRALADALGAHRLVTITGPGGIGKTRLALSLLTDTIGRALFVDLSAVTDDDAVDAVVATTLGVLSRTARTRDAVVDAIGSQRALLVVDNAEHVADAVADLATELIGRCRELRVLVTSREALGVSGEHLRPLGPLTTDAARLLLVERVEAADPHAVLDPDAVDRIGHALDGVPLAIELAAARARSMSLAEIATHLLEHGELSPTRRRGVPARHTSMTAVVEWSYVLLDERDRSVFDRLSVFPGTFDVSAALAVAGPGSDDPRSVTDALDRLITTSMLMVDDRKPTTRYRMLVPMRTVGRRHLGHEGLAAAADRHAEHFAHLVTRRAGALLDEDPDDLATAILELHNLRAAVEHAIARRDPTLAIRITTALPLLWLNYLYPEVGRWVAHAADAPGGADDLLRRLAHGQAALAAAVRGDVAFQRHAAAGEGTWWSACARALCADSVDSFAAHTTEALALVHDEHPKLQTMVDALVHAAALLTGGSPDAPMARTLAYLASTGRPSTRCIVLTMQAHEARVRGDRSRFGELVEEAYAATQTLAWPIRTAIDLRIQRLLFVFERDTEGGLREAASLLTELRDTGDRLWVQCVLARIAVMLLRLGRTDPALTLASFTREPALGAMLFDGDPGQDLLDAADLHDPAVAAACARGRALAYDDAVTLALRELAIGRATIDEHAPSRDTA